MQMANQCGDVRNIAGLSFAMTQLNNENIWRTTRDVIHSLIKIEI